MFYSDIHSHLLFGVDDGATDEAEMYALLDRAYTCGTRELALTPHFHPRYYGENGEAAERAFALLSAYAAEKYPDMVLRLGNELNFYSDCTDAIASGACRLLGGRYLLMDFRPSVDLYTVRYAMDRMLGAGYRVILAHVERYAALRGKYDLLNSYCQRGALLQVNAASLVLPRGLRDKWHLRRLFAQCPVAAVASDTHNATDRACLLDRAETVLTKRYGRETAERLLWDNPHRILSGASL